MDAFRKNNNQVIFFIINLSLIYNGPNFKQVRLFINVQLTYNIFFLQFLLKDLNPIFALFKNRP